MTIYTPNIPQPGDIPSQSQDLILQNFQSLQDAQDRNHIQLSDVVNRGKHGVLVMPEVGSVQFPDPPTTAINEGGLYMGNNAFDNQTALFFRRENKTGVFQQTVKDVVLTALPLMAGGLFNAAGIIQGQAVYNMSNCTKTGTGKYTVNFGANMTSTNYLYVISWEAPTVSGADIDSGQAVSRALGTMNVEFRRRNGGTNQYFDPTSFTVIIFGGWV